MIRVLRARLQDEISYIFLEVIVRDALRMDIQIGHLERAARRQLDPSDMNTTFDRHYDYTFTNVVQGLLAKERLLPVVTTYRLLPSPIRDQRQLLKTNDG